MRPENKVAAKEPYAVMLLSLHLLLGANWKSMKVLKPGRDAGL
jgi:hypothetical protein